MSNEELRVRVLLTVQAALLGAITPNLRAVICCWDAEEVKVTAIFDGEPSEEEKELFSEVEAEILAQMPCHEVVLECNCAEYPGKISLPRNCQYVYLRREPTPDVG